MESGLLLDVVVGECATIFKLLTSKDQALLVGWDAFLVLNLALDIVDGVTRLDFKGDGLASESLDKDLHAAAETEDQVQGRFLLDVVVAQGSAILELLAGEDETLLVRRNAFLVLNLALHVVDGVAGFDLESDGLSSN